MSHVVSANATAPAWDAIAIVNTDPIPTTRAVYVGTAGALVVTMASGRTATFLNVPSGIFPIQITGVQGGSTAADLWALY